MMHSNVNDDIDDAALPTLHQNCDDNINEVDPNVLPYC